MGEEQKEATNLCFMALKDNYEVPLLSNYSYDKFYNDPCDCDNEHNDNKELNDESSLIEKLVLKCQKLLLKKNSYK